MSLMFVVLMRSTRTIAIFAPSSHAKVASTWSPLGSSRRCVKSTSGISHLMNMPVLWCSEPGVTLLPEWIYLTPTLKSTSTRTSEMEIGNYYYWGTVMCHNRGRNWNYWANAMLSLLDEFIQLDPWPFLLRMLLKSGSASTKIQCWFT